jgi:hypothetical protein
MLDKRLLSPFFFLCRSKILAELYARDANVCIVVFQLARSKLFASKIAEAEP